MAKRQSFPPGEFIADELDARGWSQADLARILNRPYQHVNLLVKGKRRINAEIASELAAAFGTSVEVWINLQASWDAYQAPAPNREISKRAMALSTGEKAA
jgi:HTH-type transcriptional regulator/antitoxin HigA